MREVAKSLSTYWIKSSSGGGDFKLEEIASKEAGLTLSLCSSGRICFHVFQDYLLKRCEPRFDP
jgi:hypothetical protein